MIALVLAVVQLLGGNPGRLRGCKDQAGVHRSLQQLAARDWDAIEPATLVRGWPETLTGYDAIPGPGECGSAPLLRIGHRGREIDQFCECCSIFVFDRRQDKNGKCQYALRGVVLMFTSANLGALADELRAVVGPLWPDRGAEPLADPNWLRSFVKKAPVTEVFSVEEGTGEPPPQRHLKISVSRSAGGWTLAVDVYRVSFGE